MSALTKTNLLGITKDELTEFFSSLGGSEYHATKVLHAVYRLGISELDQIEGLHERYLSALCEHFTLSSLEVDQKQGSADTTQKFLFRLDDGRYIESVLIPATPTEDGKRSERMTVCVSSQVGCAYGCKFCASGLDGFTRNLSTAEIIAQLLEIRRLSEKPITNVVFMGMGEPLANYKNLDKALDIITNHWGLGIGSRHVTVSTSGLVPMIRKLSQRKPQVSLAISLHGPNDTIRDTIMPVNAKWNVEELFDALKEFRDSNNQRITLEYILIKDINDSLDAARELAERAKSIGGFVNIIPYNTVEGLQWERPSTAHCHEFRNTVKELGVMTTMRLEKGHDIDAACGQLRLRKERDL